MKATNIEWDVESHEEAELLPSEIEIPDGMTDMDEISDYISDKTGYCHKGYVLEYGTEEQPKKLVNREEAIQIIETRKPNGLFIQQAGDRWVGIDNTTGDAWTEEFEDLNACLSWLG